MAEKKRKWLPFLAAALGGPMLGVPAAMGIGSLQKGKELSDMSTEEWKKMTGAPGYEEPAALKEYQDLLGLRTRQEMPGYTEQKQAIEEGTATGLGAVSQLAGGEDRMAGLLGLMDQRRQSLRQLGIAASQYRDLAQQRYDQSFLQRAPYQERAGDWDRALWQMKMNQQEGYQQAGQQMLMDTIDKGSSLMFQGADMFMQNQWMNNMMGYGQPQSAIPQYNWQQNHPNFYNQMNTAHNNVPNLGADPYAMGYRPPVTNLPG